MSSSIPIEKFGWRQANLTTKGLLRWSAIRRNLEDNGNHDLVAFIERRFSTHAICDHHGVLSDPIVGLDLRDSSFITACPWCSSPEVRALWELQGIDAVLN